MLVQEVILENFMSYEYSRVPLKPGVNVVCGPNGSGKSSLLLGISVALGQSYTERSKKLSDLIRWGRDQGRVTLVLDNSRTGGRRPVSKINRDQIFLSRVLRRDGKYWFELENRSATKSEVVRLLSNFGVDPDNVLIIMHQGMAEQFITLTPHDKLKLVEAAVGLEPYRENVLEAQNKLSRILSQEGSVERLLESAEQTLSYWREQYDRFQQKKQLLLKRRFLERELAWAEVSQKEDASSELERQIRSRREELEKINKEVIVSEDELKTLQSRKESYNAEWTKLFEERLQLGEERAKHESSISFIEGSTKELQGWLKVHEERVTDLTNSIRNLQNNLAKEHSRENFAAAMNGIDKSCSALQSTFAHVVELKINELQETHKSSENRIGELALQIPLAQSKMDKVTSELDAVSRNFVDYKVKLALLEYQRQNLKGNLEDLEKKLGALTMDLGVSVKKAEEMGPRIVSVRTAQDILDEIRITDGRIAAMADVSEDIERMYESYSKLYLELKEKARVVAENREKALAEVRTRMEAWKKVIRSLLEHVNLEYQRILLQTGATGSVKLLNEENIEDAGIDILAGFRGARAVALDAYTHSGGERSTATMTFLLALQQRVQSPFRAIDEYDIHMDPKNREVIGSLITSSLRGLNAQYLIITPNQMFFEGRDIHIITVQNIEGISVITQVV